MRTESEIRKRIEELQIAQEMNQNAIKLGASRIRNMRITDSSMSNQVEIMAGTAKSWFVNSEIESALRWVLERE